MVDQVAKQMVSIFIFRVKLKAHREITSALGQGVIVPTQPLFPGRTALPTGIGWVGFSAGLDRF